jgi:hypothetical protein
MKITPCSLSIFFLANHFASAASIVGTNHMRGYEGNFFDLDQEFISDNGEPPDNTLFAFFHVSANSYLYSGSALDEGVSIFFVNSNDEFSEERIIGGDFTEIMFGEFHSLPTNFFLGMRTPSLEFYPTIQPGYRLPAYGWAEFQNDELGEISLVDHAIAYGSQGIFVDTTNPIPIPEPNSVALITGTVLLTLAGRFREK